ncbi:MAG: hypothetical protein WCX12_00565 [Candidatus Paceibacterota bacterium]|jgi:hypothetical protein
MKKLFPFFAIFFSLSAVAFAANLNYQSPTGHFSIALPADWEEIPQDTINQFVEAVMDSNTTTTAPKYTAGFQVQNQDYFVYPYLLIEEHDANSPTYSEILNEFSSNNLPEKANDKMQDVSGLIKNATFDKPYLDQNRQAIFMNSIIETNSGLGDNVKSLTVLFPGKNAIIQLSFSALQSEYEKNFPNFESVINSFKYNSGYEYAGPQTKKAAGIFGGGYLEDAIIVIVIFLLTFIIGRFFKKKRASNAI